MSTPPSTHDTIPTSLFQLGACVLPNGRTTHFKIECDILTQNDWESLARLAVEVLPPFGQVEGVPRGGVMFADALAKYISDGSTTLLIADDVWVSGTSMERWRAGRENTIGIVAFTRAMIAPPPWVKTLFSMQSSAERATYYLDLPPQSTHPFDGG